MKKVLLILVVLAGAGLFVLGGASNFPPGLR
jgi:hypothetical protein